MSLADELGLTQSRIVPSKSGEPTLVSGEHSILSAYSPSREAARMAAANSSTRIRLVGLGLGYLADAFGDRLTGVIFADGEWERFAAARPEVSANLVAKREECRDLSAMERAVAAAGFRGETLILDPSLDAVPALKLRFEEIIAMIKNPRVVIIHLKTAGDVLRCLAAVQAYKRSYPDVNLTFITQKPYGEIVGMAPGIDCVIELDPAFSGVPAIPRPMIGFNFGSDPGSVELLHAIQPIYSSGYVATDDGIALRDDRLNDGGTNLNAIRNRMNRHALAFVIMGLDPVLAPPILKLRAAPKDYSVVQFGAGSGADVWDPKRIDPVTLGSALGELGGRWIAVGSTEEYARAEKGGIAPEDNLCGKTSWRELAELIAGAKLFVGHDSGPTHLAAALEVPTVALFGFTSPILNAPVGARTLIVQADMLCAFAGCRIPCPERACTGIISREVILAAVETLLARDAIGKLRGAEKMRMAGTRFWLGCADIDNTDPLRTLVSDEPALGPPRDPALALLKEWTGTSGR